MSYQGFPSEEAYADYHYQLSKEEAFENWQEEEKIREAEAQEARQRSGLYSNDDSSLPVFRLRHHV